MEHKIEEFLHAHFIMGLIRINAIKLFVLKTRVHDYGEWSKVEDLRAYPDNSLWSKL